MEERLQKLREERNAREKARIDKLREMNLNKYSKKEPQLPIKPSNNYMKRPITVPVVNKRKSVLHKDINSYSKPIGMIKTTSVVNRKPKIDNVTTQVNKPDITSKTVQKPTANSLSNNVKVIGKVNIPNAGKRTSIINRNITNLKAERLNDIRTVNSPTSKPTATPKKNNNKVNSQQNVRKSLLPQKQPSSTSKVNTNRQSVFERLYQPKVPPKKPVDDIKKLQTDANYLQKVIKDSGLIYKRHTFFEPKKTVVPVRRSISAVHFKRIEKGEISNCIHKWASIGDKLDKINLKEVNEDEKIKDDKLISAVKSERKTVKFLTPTSFQLHTPRPEEMQSRLQNWLKKRGKSLDSFHHLQCFGIHHLVKKVKPLVLEEATKEEFDDENKENVPLESDSDNDSYEDNMNNKIEDNRNQWRKASFCESVDFNDTQESGVMSTESTPQVDELLLGALNDLTDLLKEGFEWEQSARWLRAIRERFPSAPQSAAYWECRAALEERRGDLPTSIHCWEEAIAKGTERSVVEANLDNLLDKFMQLKISPNSAKKKADPKLIDVKNIFKSTIIRFAVQQAKLRESNRSSTSRYTCTPVRRSGRLSSIGAGGEGRTPLRVCASFCAAGKLGLPLEFVPNDKLPGTP